MQPGPRDAGTVGIEASTLVHWRRPPRRRVRADPHRAGIDLERPVMRRGRIALDFVGPLPGSRLAWRVGRVRARLRRRKLVALLADGANPWSSVDLMQCAAALTTPSERGSLAQSIDGLLRLIELDVPLPPYMARHRDAVLAQQDALEAVAENLRDPSPSSVHGVAVVWRLLRDSTSPLFDTERPEADDEIEELAVRGYELLVSAAR